MNREGWKVFSASALGAGLGSLVALEVASWLWWLGLVVGGLVGYLSYEFKAVLAAILKAYRAARGWRPNFYFWKCAVWWILVAVSFFAWLVLTMLIDVARGISPGVGAVVALGVSGLFFGLAFPTIEAARSETTFAVAARRVTYWIFPPLVIFWHLPRGLWWIIRRIPRASLVFVRFVPRFAWQVFIRIHSEMRILCGTDAMLGAGVGYFAGSALLGALFGGLFGVVNYAFVTERWLRPRGYLPARAKSA